MNGMEFPAKPTIFPHKIYGNWLDKHEPKGVTEINY
jgi:hypothetical protein